MLCTSNKSDITHYVVSFVNENSCYFFTVKGMFSSKLILPISVLITLVNESILSDEVEATYNNNNNGLFHSLGNQYRLK